MCARIQEDHEAYVAMYVRTYVRTFIFRVDSVLEKCSRAKVNQFDAPCGHVYEDIFILDVPVDHTLRLAVFGGL